MSISINDNAVIKYFYSENNKKARIDAFLLRHSYFYNLLRKLSTITKELAITRKELAKEGVKI